MIEIEDSNDGVCLLLHSKILLRRKRRRRKFAKYNKSNHETNFNENVLLGYQNHKIRSKNLDLSFENNLATIYNEIVYNNDNTKLYADILEIDLITKNSKIFNDQQVYAPQSTYNDIILKTLVVFFFIKQSTKLTDHYIT